MIRQTKSIDVTFLVFLVVGIIRQFLYAGQAFLLPPQMITTQDFVALLGGALALMVINRSTIPISESELRGILPMIVRFGAALAIAATIFVFGNKALLAIYLVLLAVSAAKMFKNETIYGLGYVASLTILLFYCPIIVQTP